MSDVAAIADGLTKRSRRALVLIGEDWTDEGWGETLPRPEDAYSLQWGRDYGKGVVDLRLKDGTGVTCRAPVWQWKLTPFGKQVADYIRQSLTKGENA